MARWRVDYFGKKRSHRGAVEALDEKGSREAAMQFNIILARRNKIALARLEEQKRGSETTISTARHCQLEISGGACLMFL